MAIMAIDKIPETVHKTNEPKGIKDLVMQDIREAYNAGLKTFEFVGYYDSTANYIGTCAREMAYKFIREILFDEAVSSVKRKVVKHYKQKIGDGANFIVVKRPVSASPAITIKTITIGGVKRVFGEIDYDYIKHFETNLLDATDKKYSDKEMQAVLIDKARGAALRKEIKEMKGT